MPTSINLCVNQKGSAALIAVILVAGIGLVIGLYLVSQNTTWFSQAGSAQITIPYASPSITPKASAVVAASPAGYQDPFEASASAANPFDNYQNPFNNL